MSKKIVRLTESDLMRIVKRVIKENAAPYVAAAANKFINAFGTFNDDEDAALAAVYELKNINDVSAFDAIVKQKKGMTASQLLNKYMSDYDKEYSMICGYISRITGDKVNWRTSENTSGVGKWVGNMKSTFSRGGGTGKDY